MSDLNEVRDLKTDGTLADGTLADGTLADGTLADEIHKLEKIINMKKNMLFLARLSKMCNADLRDTISNIIINIDREESTWTITYTHTTNSYDPNDYLNDTYLNEDETEEIVDIISGNCTTNGLEEITSKNSDTRYKKVTVISFGKHKKYFIKGGIKLSIYHNSAGELRIINPNYDFELDLDEQKNLITEYSNNKNIPECLALSVFLYMSYNKWDDTSIVNHFGLV
jgi:hypothetical protein